METTTAVETATAVRTATAVGTATAVHLRVGGSDTTKNREDRDTCDCESFHRRPFHKTSMRTSSLVKSELAYSSWVR